MLFNFNRERFSLLELKGREKNEIVGEDGTRSGAPGGSKPGGYGREPDSAAFLAVVIRGDGEMLIVLPGDRVGGL